MQHRGGASTSSSMSYRHHASQLASVGQLLEVGPWVAQPLVESAGGMVNLPRWTVCASRPRPPPTGPLCGTSPDGQWCHVEN